MRNAQQAMSSRFNMSRRLRPWQVSHFGGMEAAKMHPLAVCKFAPDEGGTVQSRIDLQLAPVNGYMRSKAYAEVIQVFVPYQAIEKLDLGTADAGVTEMTRRRLEAGTVVGLEAEGVISKAAFVHGKNVGGTQTVSKAVRLAYLAACNHLRKMAYYDAAIVDNTETAILPALLTANILDRFDGVLDPERLVDGAINLTGELPVGGITREGGGSFVSDNATIEANSGSVFVERGGTGNGVRFAIQPDGTSLIKAHMSGTGEISLRDMMESKVLDEMIREFARMVKADPLHGEETVARAIIGLSVDYDDDCQVMYRKVHELSPQHHRPTDGPSLNDIQGHFNLSSEFATLVPRSELGGQLVTIVSVKPMETLEKQPDPHQTESWALVNRIQDEMQLDEQLLTRGELESSVATIDADTPIFWVGHNKLKHGYAAQGPNVQQTNLTEQKSSMWLYPVPTSVTPSNVLYPASIDMYPFANWNGSHVEYTFAQRANISTPLALGPSPVEKLQLFADDPTLITG